MSEELPKKKETADDMPLSDLEVPDKFKAPPLDDPLKGQTQLARMGGKNYKVMAKALKKLGCVAVQPAELAAFAALGVEMDSASMVKLARSGAYLSQAAVVQVLKDLMRIEAAATDKAKVKLVAPIGFLVGKLTGINKIMFEDGKKEAAENSAKVAKAPQQFVPLQIIISQNAPVPETKVLEVEGGGEVISIQ